MAGTFRHTKLFSFFPPPDAKIYHIFFSPSNEKAPEFSDAFLFTINRCQVSIPQLRNYSCTILLFYLEKHISFDEVLNGFADVAHGLLGHAHEIKLLPAFH